MLVGLEFAWRLSFDEEEGVTALRFEDCINARDDVLWPTSFVRPFDFYQFGGVVELVDQTVY